MLLSPHGRGLRAGMVLRQFVSRCTKPLEFCLQMICGLNLRRKGGNATKAALPGRSRGGGEGMEPLRYTSPCCLWLCHCLGSDLESMG